MHYLCPLHFLLFIEFFKIIFNNGIQLEPNPSNQVMTRQSFFYPVDLAYGGCLDTGYSSVTLNTPTCQEHLS